MRQWFALGLMSAGLAGCHSAYVTAVVRNQTGGPVSLVELDYPSASFGTEALAAGSAYRYRFKILGSGPTKVSWTDAQRREHAVPGPTLQEGQEGTLDVTLDARGGAEWSPHLHR